MTILFINYFIHIEINFETDLKDILENNVSLCYLIHIEL